MTGHEEQDLRAGGARGAGGLTELLQMGHDVQCPPLVNQAGIERWEQVGHQQHPRRRPPPGLQVGQRHPFRPRGADLVNEGVVTP